MLETDHRLIQKAEAYQFLKKLELWLKEKLPPPNEIRAKIRELNIESKDSKSNSHLRTPESAFTNHFLVPRIFEIVAQQLGQSEAQKSLLSEYQIMRKTYCGSTSAQRQERHPFSKRIADGQHAIMKRWKGTPNKQTIQSAPDLALHDPFRPHIIFEVKYFEKHSRKQAETELVTDLYQAFFYRGLPYVPATKSKPSWDYDYACLIAYDASLDGTLCLSWKSLPEKVARSFWDGANVFPMIFRAVTP